MYVFRAIGFFNRYLSKKVKEAYDQVNAKHGEFRANLDVVQIRKYTVAYTAKLNLEATSISRNNSKSNTEQPALSSCKKPKRPICTHQDAPHCHTAVGTETPETDSSEAKPQNLRSSSPSSNELSNMTVLKGLRRSQDPSAILFQKS
jgi:hypothetical protein